MAFIAGMLTGIVLCLGAFVVLLVIGCSDDF